MRLRELRAAEAEYLIANEWHSTTSRGERRWHRKTKRYGAVENMPQDAAVTFQKNLDLLNQEPARSSRVTTLNETAELRAQVAQAEAQWRKDQDTIAALTEQVEALEIKRDSVMKVFDDYTKERLDIMSESCNSAHIRTCERMLEAVDTVREQVERVLQPCKP